MCHTMCITLIWIFNLEIFIARFVDNISFDNSHSCEAGAPVYLASVLEYLNAETLEMTGNAANSNYPQHKDANYPASSSACNSHRRGAQRTTLWRHHCSRRCSVQHQHDSSSQKDRRSALQAFQSSQIAVNCP